MKRKLLFAAALLAGAMGFNAYAQPDLPLRADFGGSTVDLKDLNIGDGDYTLEVQGTVGTVIKVAADNLEYIPKTNGTVRFVKSNGTVYVYEGSEYVSTITSEKAAFIYAELTDTNCETGNMLQNPSFETPGKLVGGTNYEFGTPWLTNVTIPASMGIRVTNACGSNDTKNGSWDLLWRGSGNNNYFSQEIEAIKPLKGYRAYIRQVASANGNAEYIIGLGNVAGDYSYASVSYRLGIPSDDNITRDKLHTMDLVIGSTVGEKSYFTVHNTPNNTTKNGNECLTHIDWVGLVAADNFPVEGAISATFLNGVAYAPATAKGAYETLKAEAEEMLKNEEYKNVAGTEKATLQALINATVENSDDAYNEASFAMNDAMDAFVAAKDSYDAYAEAKDEAADVDEEKVLAVVIENNDKATAADAAVAAIVLPKAVATKAASADNPQNVDYVVNGTFEENTNGWIATGGFQNSTLKAVTASDFAQYNMNGDFTGKVWENWTPTGNAAPNKMYQEIKNVPNGTYRLTIAAFVSNVADPNESQYVFANEDKFFLASKAATYDVYTVVINNTLSIGLEQTTATANWMGMDNVSLTYYGADDAYATLFASEEDYNDLADAIETAQEKELGFEKGQYAPYNNLEEVEALMAALLIDSKQNNAKDVVTRLTTILNGDWTVNADEVDIVYNPNFEEANGTNPVGWTRDNNAWGQQQTGLTDTDKGTAWYYNQSSALRYGATGGYLMPLEANTWYVLEFKYRSQVNNSNTEMKASVLNAAGEGLIETAVGANRTTSFVTKTLTFQTGEKGNYVISLANTGNTFFADVYLTKVAEGTANMSVKAGKFGTFAALFDVKTPEGVEAYTVKGIDENDVLEMSDPMTTIPAGTPVILKNTTEQPVNITVSGQQYLSEGGESAYLTGVYTENTTVPVGSYVLQTQGDVQAFYVVKDTPLDAAINRAYLTVPSVGVKAFYFGTNGDATAIKGVEVAEGAENAVIYNLAGQRVVNPTKGGIYIVNGQKVLVK